MTNEERRLARNEASRRSRAKAKARAKREAQVTELVRVFGEGYQPSENHWVFYAARRFGGYDGNGIWLAADAVLAHFLPSGDEAADARRRANGYAVTTDYSEMLRITRRAAS